MTTGPQSSPFSLVEDMIILVSSNFYGRQVLYGEECEFLHGSCLTLPFWSKVIRYFPVDRTTDAMRSR